jgi:hypothetical protein
VLRYLLDEHLSPAIAAEIAAHRLEIPIVALRDWQDGAFLGADDATILVAAHADGRSLVTFDLRTIPPLLRTWSESGLAHGGVVFAHAGTFALDDIGGLVRALIGLWDAAGELDWTDRVVFLSR